MTELAAAAPEADHHDPIPSVAYYLAVFAALIFLTGLTVALSFVELGPWHLVLGLIIATTKAILVALFFMHVIHSPRLTWIVIAASLLFLVILIGLTMADYVTRAWSVL
jgi:cytochrome c oxidase subunit 4